MGGEESAYNPRFENRLINCLAITHLPPKPFIASAPPDINHSSISRMRLQILTLLCYFFAFVLATSKYEDKSDIEELTLTFNLFFDSKKFDKLDEILTLDVIFDAGAGPIQGFPNVISTLSNIIPIAYPTYTILSKQLIEFHPPFDKYGRSNLASSVSYATLVSFGGANLTHVIYVKFVDNEIVRTNEPGFGGWRFKNRKIESAVSFSTTNT